MNTTIKELADIGAEAALKALTDESSAMTIDSGRHHSFNQDRPAREAFAAAVAERVREETPWGANGESREEWMARQREKASAQEKELETLRAELAKCDELIERYKPRPVSVQPTKADADHNGRVLLIGPGGVSTQALHTDWRVHSSWTYWLPCSVDAYGLAPSPEEIERREFKEWWTKESENVEYPISHQVIAEKAWQAARAGKEGK